MDKTVKDRMKRYREKKRNESVTVSVTGDSVTKENVTQGTVPASYVQGLKGKMYEVLPERPRYLELSDSSTTLTMNVQVLDRANQPEGHRSEDMILRMQFANESSYNFIPNKIKRGLR